MDKKILQSLRKEYDKTIPIKLNLLGQLIDALKKRWNKDDLIALRFHIHKIAGSAGSYGYDTVSEIGKVLDQASLDELDHFDPLHVNRELLAKFDQSFESIKQGFSHE